MLKLFFFFFFCSHKEGKAGSKLVNLAPLGADARLVCVQGEVSIYTADKH